MLVDAERFRYPVGPDGKRHRERWYIADGRCDSRIGARGQCRATFHAEQNVAENPVPQYPPAGWEDRWTRDLSGTLVYCPRHARQAHRWEDGR